MKIDIPNKESFELKNIVFDYNGTIAIDGKIIDGVSKNIDELSNLFDFYVITADTYGSVENELKNTNCKVITISKDKQDEKKLQFIKKLNPKTVLSVGNGRNDKLMLKESIIGISILQDEGLCTQTLLSSDILVNSIFDVFGFLKDKNRLIATLRN
ncbi:ATPase P [Malaciobacter molluscorum LMG 25693]|uniref:ATPase P n=1 Tax=Malaciobacter molluscorum LMG 25693 TaxID=870501 RepID=A0A2G1DKY1_9BACT|nr:HAD family hydrolase [Malaciobacter molluscorum]AXX92714.1 putative soluble P-type ATPase [Malaciobacter molluscorum LMG 25693]PHO19130.1 ATPase P [Malaciobacter molluscorum LMG 25693]